MSLTLQVGLFGDSEGLKRHRIATIEGKKIGMTSLSHIDVIVYFLAWKMAKIIK